MLKSMRKGAKNIFVKAFLLILAFSFVAWGIGDIFRGRTANSVAKVGATNISYDEFRNRMQSEISRYQQFFGITLTEEQIEQYGLKAGVLNQLIDDKMIEQRVNDLNLKGGADAAKDQLSANSMFFDESGEFSPEQFENILKRSGINKNDYVDSIKQDMAKRLLIDTLSSVPSSLKYATNALYAYQNQERDFDALIIPSNYIKNVGEPSETDLVQYYQEHPEKFSVPELREVTYFKYAINDVSSSIQINPEAIKEEYQSNISEYQEPEKRDVDQYLFDVEADALKALENLKAGKIAAYVDKKTSLGLVDVAGLPDNVNKVVFNMDENTYSQPIKTDLGWHVFKINKIILSATKSFDDVKLSIEEKLKEDTASEVFYESASQIEDVFASGLTIEEVAKKFDIVLHKIPSIDSSGKGITGKILNDIADPQVLVPMVFATELGEVSPMTLLSDNLSYVVVRVDVINPQRIKALDEVKGTVITLWKEVEKSNKVKEAAVNAAKRLADGEDINKISTSMKLKIKNFKNVKRASEAGLEDVELAAPYELIEDIFTKQIGQSSEEYKAASGDYVVAKLKMIKEAQINEDMKNELRETLKGEFIDDILEQYRSYLHSVYPVEKYEALINSSNL